MTAEADDSTEAGHPLAAGPGRRVPSTPWGPPPPLDPPPEAARSALAAVYAEVDAALAAASDTCRTCGRCCRFQPGGIVLFASSLEVATLLAEAGPPNPDRPSPNVGPFAAWTCPYQVGDRCGARAVRMLGCRTYFCTPAAARGEAVYAEGLAAVRAVAGDHGYPWWYGPAKVALDAAAHLNADISRGAMA